jgi:hypothetical protein
MSLITTASPWLNEDTKKRIPTIPRKQLSSTPSSSPTSSYSQPSISQPSSFTPVESPNILTEPMEEYQEKENPTQPQTEDSRTSKINDMIKQMTNINADNAGNGLADFKPLENPVMTTKKTDILGTSGVPYNSTFSETKNTLYPQQQQYNQRPSTQFSENTMDLSNLSNYQQSYEVPPATKPYYTNFGISNNSNIDEKLNDRLSYITHLLEEMQTEKTSNISEEFVMYSMLGIFVIYIVDAFSRTGKYTR